ncbi:MAG: hypothetical protein IPJ23_19110 [Ignavibacteriales bacterium]|nr:hypothetical protein [Ignavibacteriales bacterium]
MFSKKAQPYYSRPKAWEKVYKWHLGQVSDSDPSKKSAIFVVHGMGLQAWSETAASIRIGIEDSLESFGPKELASTELPAPFVQEGFWADYSNLKTSFKDEWKRFEKSKYSFFSLLWKARSTSSIKTLKWFLWQLVRLVFDPKVFSRATTLANIIYFVLLILAPPIFFLIFIFSPSIMSDVLNDVRMYCSPKGMVERAIVQRIDYRVGKSFLRLIGLDWNFRELNNIMGRYKVDHNFIEFDKVYWVAHSLGSVISYNVLSDILNRADELSKTGDENQRRGVEKFWSSLQNFITIGSPLDKIAVLFENEVLRSWPERILESEPTEDIKKNNSVGHFLPSWWINFWHWADPVSGALSNSIICPENNLLRNIHLDRFFYLPGLAHIKYWSDSTVLKYLLSKFYGLERLNKLKQPEEKSSSWFSNTIQISKIIVHLTLIIGFYLLIAYGVYKLFF